MMYVYNLQENENKCERICEKIKSELKFQEDCERKIKAMEEKRKYLSHINQKLRDSVHRLQPYNVTIIKIFLPVVVTTIFKFERMF